MPSITRTGVPRTWVDVFTKQEKLQLRKRLVWGAVAFTLLSWCLLIAINFGGYPSNNHYTILAEDVYVIQWVSIVPLGVNDTQSVTLTVNYYLNAIWLLDEFAPTPLLLQQGAGLDFNYDDISYYLLRYVQETYPGGVFDGYPTSPPASELAAFARLAGRSDFSNDMTDNSFNAFGHSTYTSYVVGMSFVCSSWSIFSYLTWRRFTDRGHWTFQLTCSLVGTLAIFAASGIMTNGANGVLPLIQDEYTAAFVGKTFLTFAWCGALAQVLSFLLLCLAEHVRRKIDEPWRTSGHAGTATVANRRASGVQRARDPEEGFDDLPRYERNDPLGRPPSIGGSAGTDCIPLEMLDSGQRGPAEPAPEYQEYNELTRPPPIRTAGASPATGPESRSRHHTNGDEAVSPLSITQGGQEEQTSP